MLRNLIGFDTVNFSLKVQNLRVGFGFAVLGEDNSWSYYVIWSVYQYYTTMLLHTGLMMMLSGRSLTYNLMNYSLLMVISKSNTPQIRSCK